MALYLGTNKVKINLNDIVYRLNIFHTPSNKQDIVLMSSDNYVLKDSYGLYLLPKSEINGMTLLTRDNYILKDSNGLYLLTKRDINGVALLTNDNHILKDINGLYLTTNKEE